MNQKFCFSPAAFAAAICLVLTPAWGQDQAGTTGIFQGSQDIGTPPHAGSVEYDAAGGTYKVTGGGANIWFTNDSFHYVWTKVSGDVALSADIAFIGTGGDPHRKACLMVRQSLDADSAYADAALHGVGLTSLQYRESKGAATHEIQSNVSGPKRVRIEKRGKYVSMSIAGAGEELHPAGGSFRISFEDPFYVGLAVSAHNDKVSEQAVFSNVELKQGGIAAPARQLSTLETVTIASTDRRVVYCSSNHLEAPNWSRDGKFFLFNSRDHIYRLPVTGGEPEMVDTGAAHRVNNDHGISPDGTRMAISDQSSGVSLIYTLPITGGEPTRITPTGPSYWHGWSPDGKTLAFCGVRNGEFDVYTVPAEGGPETRLTTAPGLDDGPEYTPDGQYIYFNSERTGQMQIWRMHPDGTQQEQVTSDEYNNWFAHPSPNGRWIVLLSYEKDVTGHPGGKDVMLRIMPAAGGKPQVLAKLFGGQGTINVPSWSPDSRMVAFVSYSAP